MMELGLSPISGPMSVYFKASLSRVLDHSLTASASLTGKLVVAIAAPHVDKTLFRDARLSFDATKSSFDIGARRDTEVLDRDFIRKSAAPKTPGAAPVRTLPRS